MSSAKARWIIPLISLFLLMQPIGVVGESDNDSIIAAEGITVSVNFGNGSTLVFRDLHGSTVLDVTSEVLDVQVDWYGPLAYVRGIEGVLGEGQYGWEYWVNGEFASVAVNLYSLELNDTVEWIYSTPDPQPLQDPTLIPGASIVLISGVGFLAIVYIQTSRRLR